MSTLKVDAIRHNSATSDAITTAADGTCTAKLTSIGGGGLSHRNIIINGAMNVAQYGTSQSNTGNIAGRSVDRFFCENTGSTSAVQTFSQEVDGPAGFYYSAKATCTTALTSYGTGSQSKIEYRIEGTDLAHVQLGTSNAQTLSVSFYVKSNKTGNSAIGLINQNNDRSFVHQYTIASANTWQRVSFKVVGDTTGTWNKDTSIGMRMRWGTFGTDFQTSTFDAWQAGQKMATSNSPINFNATTNDYLQITGVQVELGDTVTSFEHRSINDELLRCKRYYYQEYRNGNTGGNGAGIFAMGMTANSSSGSIYAQMNHPVEMRAAPNVTFSGTFAAHRFGVAINQITAANMSGENYHNSTTSSTISGTNSGSTPGQGTLAFLEGVPGTIMFSAEL